MVTGGLGYVGGVTSKLLVERGHDILIVDDFRDSVTPKNFFGKDQVVRCRISEMDDKVVRRFSPDVVLHFAASAAVGLCEDDPMGAVLNNVSEWAAFVGTCLKAGVKRFVNSGTCSVYGVPERLPVSENHPTAPMSWYGKTKLMAEELLVRMARQGLVEFSGLRYFNVVGTAYGVVERRKKEERLLPKALDAAVAGETLTINGLSWPTTDGTCVRDYVHVQDIAEGHLAAAEKLVSGEVVNEIINLGTGVGSSIFQVVQAVSKVTGVTLSTRKGDPRPGDVPAVVADSLKAQRVLGWVPKMGLEQMIESMWAARKEAK